VLLDPAEEAISRHSHGAPHPNHRDLPRAEQCVRPRAAEPKCDRHVAHRQQHRHRCRQIRPVGLRVAAKLRRGRSQGQWGSGVGLRASTPISEAFRGRRNGWGFHWETELPRHDHRWLHRATLRTFATRGVVTYARRAAIGPSCTVLQDRDQICSIVLRMPGFRSQTAYIFAAPMLSDLAALGSD
jgi:hypothetical protein